MGALAAYWGFRRWPCDTHQPGFQLGESVSCHSANAPWFPIYLDCLFSNEKKKTVQWKYFKSEVLIVFLSSKSKASFYRYRFVSFSQFILLTNIELHKNHVCWWLFDGANFSWAPAPQLCCTLLNKQTWRKVTKVLQLQSHPCGVIFAAELKPVGAKIMLKKGQKTACFRIFFFWHNTSHTEQQEANKWEIRWNRRSGCC